MSLKDKLTGSWKTQGIKRIALIAYVVDLKKDGKLLIRPVYKNPLIERIYKSVEFQIEGRWGVTSSEKLNLSFETTTWTPSRVADQVLKTLKINVSSDEFISKVAAAFFKFVGLGSSGGEVKVKFIDDDTIKLGDFSLHRKSS